MTGPEFADIMDRHCKDAMKLNQEVHKLRLALTTIKNHAVGEFGYYGDYEEIAKIASEALS